MKTLKKEVSNSRVAVRIGQAQSTVNCQTSEKETDEPLQIRRKHGIMSTEEKQATPKVAFVFLVPLENEQPA